MSLDLHPARTAVSEHGPVRRYPRTLFSVPVTLRHLMTGGIRSLRGISLDISEGGFGAIVRHTSSVRSGFEFLGLTAEERQQIANATGNC